MTLEQVKDIPPFLVVLVDIKKAGKNREIHCVEAPLTGDQSLKFVALSYRWGELQEAIVDTGVGYLASVTSFYLPDFYDLCSIMTREPDLKGIDYVWVDAICVDQTNMKKRKATIYQMTNIYDRASFIIAVPDLHKQHLIQTSTQNQDVTNSLFDHDRYIYHLIHGHADQLVQLDEEYLDKIYVPKNDIQLRQSLATFTDHFADGIMKHKVHNDDYDPKQSLDDIKNALVDAYKSECRVDFAKIYHTMEYQPTDDFDRMMYNNDNDDLDEKKCLHKGIALGDTLEYNNNGLLPSPSSNNIDLFHRIMKETKHDEWKQRISERVECIQQLIVFLEDLVKDWATRVWVISEYNIAKKENKMKYWFLHLNLVKLDCISFFKLDFFDTNNINNNIIRWKQQENCIFKNGKTKFHALTAKCDDTFQQFHHMMIHQLTQQTFLEMMLKSKASRHEDRFYAILPSTEYKDKLIGDHWHITGLTSVKLRLFDIMNTKHKVELLFLSASCRTENWVLPTFATSFIDWPFSGSESIDLKQDIHPCNFDLTSSSTIMLFTTTTTNQKKHDDDDDDQETIYKLNIKPKEFEICTDFLGREHHLSIISKKNIIVERLGLVSTDPINIVRIPCYGQSVMEVCSEDFDDMTPDPIHLVGSPIKNKWMIISHVAYSLQWTHQFSKDKDVGFDIY